MFIIILFTFLEKILTSSQQRAIITNMVEFERKSNFFQKNPLSSDIIFCLAQCMRSDNCTCVRFLANDTSICEVIDNGINELRNDTADSNYVYYSLVSVMCIKAQQDLRKEKLSKRNFFQYFFMNIALNKPASQSSVFILNTVEYTADRAVDGNLNTDLFKKPYISHTKNDTEADICPWWRVDLKKEYIIHYVRVLNRKDYAERMHDLEIRVGNHMINNDYNDTPFRLNNLCSFHIGANIESEEWRTYICEPCSTKGRYVSIQIVRYCDTCKINSTNVLSMAEVEVYGL